MKKISEKKLADQPALIKTQIVTIKKLSEKANRLTYQFYKQSITIRMNGYDESIANIGNELDQSNKEGYKWGWLNALTVLNVHEKNTLRYWYDPGVLEYPNPPYKLDSSWIPTDAIPVSLIRKYLGDYGLQDEETKIQPQHLITNPSSSRKGRLRDFCPSILEVPL